jgi:hypothetical protein
MDATSQLLKQFDTSFEFNELFLATILEHSSSNLYGQFLCSTEFETIQSSIYENTQSLWFVIFYILYSIFYILYLFIYFRHYFRSLENLQEFKNPLYYANEECLIPNVKLFQLKFWDSYYFRWIFGNSKLMNNQQYLKLKSQEKKNDDLLFELQNMSQLHKEELIQKVSK